MTPKSKRAPGLPENMKIHIGKGRDDYDFDMHGLSEDPSFFLNQLRDYCLSHGYTREDWEQITMETRQRESMKPLYNNGLTNSLLDSMILAIGHARMARNNRVATIPEVSYKTGNLACTICDSEPVTTSFTLVPNRDPPEGYDDITFVFFICEKHARDPDLMRHDIIDRHIWLKCYVMREEWKRSGK